MCFPSTSRPTCVDASVPAVPFRFTCPADFIRSPGTRGVSVLPDGRAYEVTFRVSGALPIGTSPGPMLRPSSRVGPSSFSVRLMVWSRIGIFGGSHLHVTGRLHNLDGASFTSGLDYSVSGMGRVLSIRGRVDRGSRGSVYHMLGLPGSFFADGSVRPRRASRVFCESITHVGTRREGTGRTCALLTVDVGGCLGRGMVLPGFRHPSLSVARFLKRPGCTRRLTSRLENL